LYEGGTTSDTIYTVSTGKIKTYNTTTYNVFTNTDGVTEDSSYYRKGGGIYYEYFPAALNIFNFDTPTAFEYVFLNETLAPGTTWNIPVSGIVGGNPTTGSIKGTIIERAVPATVSGVLYPDVIKVRLQYQFQVGPLNQEVYRTEQWYAKGKGLIKFIDYNQPPFTQPADVLNATRIQIF
jgi:hypothetical protein